MESHIQPDLEISSRMDQEQSLESNIESSLQPYLQPDSELHQQLASAVNTEAVADPQPEPKKKRKTKPKSDEKQEIKIRKPHQKEETIKLMQAKVQGTIEYLGAKGLPHTKQDVFEHFGIARTRGYEMLGNRDRRKRKPGDPETRGRPSKLSKETVNRMDEILQAWGLEGRAMTWKELAAEAEVPHVSWRTIQRTMQKRGYRRCKACSKTYAAPDMADVSSNFTPVASQGNSYVFGDGTVLQPESMEFVADPRQTLNLMQKPGENHCANCNQQPNEIPAPLHALPLS